MNETDASPWFRQFWPWFLIALPASAVVAGITTVVIAATGSDDLVVDDYGRIGVLTAEKLARDRAARELGLEAVLNVDPVSGAANLRIEGHDAADLHLQFVHPTVAEKDRSCTLAVSAGGSAGCRLEGIGPGRWKVVVEGPDGDWRLSGRVGLTDRPVRLELSPRPAGDSDRSR